MISNRFGWTYQHYMQQPKWYVNLLWEALGIDAQAEIDRAEKLKQELQNNGK